MKKKWLVLTLVLVGGVLSFFYPWTSYFEPVKITSFSSSRIPYINIEIEGKVIPVGIGFGIDTDLELTEEVLQNLTQKSFLGSEGVYGIKGKKRPIEVYEIPQFKIGTRQFQHAKIRKINLEVEQDLTLTNKETNSSETLERVGWKPFQKYNLFLDCENELIAFCDSLKTLRKKGYSEDFVEVPFFLVYGKAIAFEAEIDRGSLLCVLNTGCTLNLIASKEKSSDFNLDNVYTVSSFKVGGRDFGETTFSQVPFKLPVKIDAFIGMKFIEPRKVFIDFKNQKLYFSIPMNVND